MLPADTNASASPFFTIFIATTIDESFFPRIAFTGGIKDEIMDIEELAAELKNCTMPQILVGDGAQLCYNDWKERGLGGTLAPEHLRFQSAWGVARAALELARAGQLTDAAGLTPVYHRLSQAERERLAREQETTGQTHPKTI